MRAAPRAAWRIFQAARARASPCNGEKLRCRIPADIPDRDIECMENAKRLKIRPIAPA
jgi:hypothetical protein